MRVPHLDFWPHKSLIQQGVIFIIWHSGTRWRIYQMRAADISMFIIIQMYRKRKVTYYELCSIFFWNIDFQCPKGGFTFNEKDLNLTSVSPWIYPMTKCGQSGIKIVYNHNNDDYVITGAEKMNLVRVPHPLFWSHKSFTQQGTFFLFWYSVIRWPMYQMKSIDISIIIVIEMCR